MLFHLLLCLASVAEASRQEYRPGTDPNDEYALLAAAHHNQVDEVRTLLLSQGSEPWYHQTYTDGRNALHMAAEAPEGEDPTAVMELLLEHSGLTGHGKALLCNVTDHFGATPLYYAAQRNKVEAVKLLLQQGASPDVYAESFQYKTPLLVAIQEKSDPAILKLLLEHPNSTQRNYRFNGLEATPLHLAAIRNSPEAVRLLLQHGADHLAKTSSKYGSNGETPLHWAAMGNSSDAIQVLLEQPGAPVNQQDSDGKTPIMLAVGEAAHWFEVAQRNPHIRMVRWKQEAEECSPTVAKLLAHGAIVPYDEKYVNGGGQLALAMAVQKLQAAEAGRKLLADGLM